MKRIKNYSNQDYNISTQSNQPFESKERPSLFGFYLGIVKDNKDVMKMGRLRVYIPELSSDPEDENQWITVDYVAPFAGATNIIYNRKDGTTMNDTQQSYGFWFIPPDINNLVVVGFINGEPGRGIWFGCMYQNQMNHMVPGIPPGKSFDQGENDIDPPVVEYNKRKGNETTNPINPLRPRFEPLHEALTKQGLYTDAVRGPSNAGARREAPSQVYGFKTPRGHHLVIDDGEIEFDESGNPIIENNEIKRKDNTEEYIKLRTRHGAQIIINDTLGYIYVITKEGNSWCELNDNGIYYYTTGELVIRSEGTMNFHSDKDMNFHARGDINFYTENDFTLKSENNLQIKSNKSFIYTNKNQHIYSSNRLYISSDEKIQVKAEDNIEMKGSNIHLNSFDIPKAKKAKTKKKLLHEDIKKKGKEQTYSIVDNLATHEPYAKHPKLKSIPTINDYKVITDMYNAGHIILKEENEILKLPEETDNITEPLEDLNCIDAVSSIFESAGKTDAIGYDDSGGWSYGTYQIATKTGTMESFIKWSKIRYPELASELEQAGGARAAREGDPVFKNKWKELAQKNPQTFRKQQFEFIAETHTKPVYSHLESKYNINPESRSKIFQSVLYSTAVQHGPYGARKIIDRAFENKNPSSMSDEELIKLIYNERFAKDPTSPTGFKYFRNKNLVNVKKGLINRSQKEPQRALQLLQQEKSGNLICK